MSDEKAIEKQVVQVTCPMCGGQGLAGIVSRDRATDAEEPEMEGQGMPCSTCGGDGWILEPVNEALRPRRRR